MQFGTYFSQTRDGLKTAFHHHPLAMLAGLAGSCFGVAGIYDNAHQEVFARLTAILWLGITLSLSVDLISAGGFIQKKWRIIFRFLPFPILALAWLGIRNQPNELLFFRIGLWGVASHCLVAVSPFLNSRGWNSEARFDDEDLRGFNLQLFERAIQAVAFSQILFGGMALALAACDSLFHLSIQAKLYPSLWYGIVGVFQTAYLLNGIPKSSEEWRNRGMHPALAFLPRFILLPLGVVYLVILYAYVVKTLALREWPRGWASSLILVYSGLMLLTLLLVDKSGTEKARDKHRKLTRILFGALAPLLVLLYLAVGRRIYEYGCTEERYLGIALAVWLTLMCVAHLKAGRTLVIGIPLSLGMAAFLISFGPWGASSVSLNSQMGRLEKMLIEAHRLENGKLRKREGNIKSDLQKNISVQLDWLQNRKQTDRIRKWLATSGESCVDCVQDWGDWPGSASVMGKMGLEYQGYRSSVSIEKGTCAYSSRREHRAIPVAGFEHLLSIGNFWGSVDSENKWTLKGSGSQYVNFAWRNGDFRVQMEKESETMVDWKPLLTRLENLKKTGVVPDSIPGDSIYAELIYAGRQWKFQFGSITLDTLAKPIRLKTFSDGVLLIGPEIVKTPVP